MNTPNKLTILRVILIPFFVFFLLTDYAGGEEVSRYLALAVFIAASLTDTLDGYIAAALLPTLVSLWIRWQISFWSVPR